MKNLYLTFMSQFYFFSSLLTISTIAIAISPTPAVTIIIPMRPVDSSIPRIRLGDSGGVVGCGAVVCGAVVGVV